MLNWLNKFCPYNINLPRKELTSIKSRLMVVMGYLGAVIGAGFASGQEITQFFVSYGLYGLKGCIVAGLLFMVCGGVLLYMAHNKGVSNYQEMLSCFFGYKLGLVVDFLLVLFLFLGVSTMLSASGAVFYEHLYISKKIGILLTYIIVVLFLIGGKNGLIISYNVLVPIKMVLLMIISGYAAFIMPGKQVVTYTAFLCPAESKFWILSSILYVAYNFALAMVVLTEYQSITNRRNGTAGAMWGGFILGVLVLLNYLALSKFLPVVMHYEVPMLYVAGNISIGAKHIYTLVLWVGILTTALANAYGFSQRLAGFTGIRYCLCLVICMTLALPVSMQSFSSLVGKIYPLFGILGTAILVVLLYQGLKDMIAEIYYNIIVLIKAH